MASGYTDGAALLDLIHKHSDALARFARRLVGSADDAEEIVQEALLRTYKHKMERATKPRELKASVYKITHNLSVDHLRKKRHRLMDREVMDQQPNPHTTSPDEVLFLQALREAVRQAIDALPKEYREVISLRFGMGLTYRSIARTLGVSLATVESRLHRAKKRLRSELRPWAVPVPVPKARVVPSRA